MRRANRLSLVLAAASLTACADSASTFTSPSSARRASSRVPSTGPVSVGVVTTVYDVGASGDSLLTRSDDYNGIGFATYSPISGPRNGLNSGVSSDGSWSIFLGGQTVRTLHLMLADAGLPFANGYYWSSVEMGSRCFDQAGSQLNIQLLAAGASYDNCSLIVDFDIGTKHTATYKLAMGPKFAGTGRASVACNADDGTYCTSWTIAPNDTVANARVAILTASNGTTSLDGNVYTNSYRVDATKQ